MSKVPSLDINRLRVAIDEMESDPFAGDIVYLVHHESGYRRRVGNWRIFFSLHKDKKIITIEHIRRRTSTTY